MCLCLSRENPFIPLSKQYLKRNDVSQKYKESVNSRKEPNFFKRAVKYRKLKIFKYIFCGEGILVLCFEIPAHRKSKFGKHIIVA